MFPITVAIMPVYLVIRQMQLIDSLWAVILVQTAFGIAGNTLILRGFFLSIPVELQDAALIDGCSTFGFFWRILLPLAQPALAAVGALTMIVSWNDLLTPWCFSTVTNSGPCRSAPCSSRGNTVPIWR